MKNFYQMFFTAPGDGGGSVSGFGWFYTLEEAQTYYDGLNAGGGGEIEPAGYYVLLNKFNVGWLVGLAGATVSLPFRNYSLFTQDRELAENFSTDNPGAAGWQTDVVDKKWIENVQLAKTTLAKNASIAVGTAKGFIDLTAIFNVTIQDLISIGANLEASVLAKTLSDWLANKISTQEAVDIYESVTKPFF
jgi:hypothetical protein